MADEAEVRQALRWQAAFCERSDAPVTARICTALADALDRASLTGARALGWAGDPIADALPLRLAGPFHALFRAGRGGALDPVYRGEVTAPEAVARAVRGAIALHDAEIARWLDGPPQTNEPSRSAALMAGLLVLAERWGGAAGARFELLEIGSSAGLNLLIDRYAYDLGGVRVGPADGGLSIAPEWRGAPPPAVPVTIESVRGVDIAPVDLAAPGQAERLTAYVWADQADRLDRIVKAIALARAHPPRLEQGDAAAWVEARLAQPQPEGVARVLMHSIVWQYLPPESRERIEAAMAAAAAKATRARPLGWVTLEADRSMGRHELRVRGWPDDRTGGESALLGTTHPHASWVEWRG